MTIPTHILVIDDDPTMLDSCRQILSGSKCLVETAENGEAGLQLMKEAFFDIIILDLKMPGLNGMDVLKRIKKNDPETIVIVITGFATVDSAVGAMKNGAYDFIPKPFTPDELRIVIDRAIDKRKLVIENRYLQLNVNTTRESDLIIGNSKVMHEISELVQKVGPTESTVLITGESGTGKELISKAIHNQSPRKSMPFITVDCSTLVENLFESELFGHVKGSFTGATATKHGRLELANGGTVFFDEITNIGITVQAKLLRAIQEREITKVGSTQAIKIDIRIIAATNNDLIQAIKEGKFREDLFYRLSVVPIHLAPLRERQDDIPLLADYFLQKYNKKRRRSIKGISERTMKALINYDWPGNVRELENAIERAVVLTENEFIQPSDLSYYNLSLGLESINKKTLCEVEKEHIERILQTFNRHKLKTAKALCIDRKTLRLKMKKYGIDP
jgi:DNA-binding NtrC family response regulator